MTETSEQAENSCQKKAHMCLLVKEHYIFRIFRCSFVIRSHVSCSFIFNDQGRNDSVANFIGSSKPTSQETSDITTALLFDLVRQRGG